MEYDKNSFLAGIAVGRRLKGWASSGDLSIGLDGSSAIRFGSLSVDPKYFNGYVVSSTNVIFGDLTVLTVGFVEA